MIVRASRMALAKCETVSTPMSMPAWPSIGEFDRDRLGNDLVAFDRFIAVDHLMICRQKQFDPFSLRALLDLQRRLQHVVLNQRLADSKAFGLEKCVGHRAANQNLIDLAIDERIDDWNLVGNFCATENGYKRMIRITDDTAQVFQLFLHQQTRRGLLDVFGDARSRSMRAMRGAKSIVDIRPSQRLASCCAKASSFFSSSL